MLAFRGILKVCFEARQLSRRHDPLFRGAVAARVFRMLPTEFPRPIRQRFKQHYQLNLFAWRIGIQQIRLVTGLAVLVDLLL